MPAPYPKAMIAAIKADYISGRYRRIVDLCAAYGIKRVTTVSQWKIKQKWDVERDAAIAAAAVKVSERVTSELADINTTHFKIFQLFLKQVLQRFQMADEDPKGHAITLHQLETMSLIARRAQDGQRMALGEDASGKILDSGPTTILQIFQTPEVRRACMRVIDLASKNGE